MLALLVGSATAASAADDVRYEEPADFIADAFGGHPPNPGLLWLTGDLRTGAESILGHPPEALRVRYWRDDGRSAWILDEIGKERPITAGIVIDHGRIEQLKVLVYRESRGAEVRYPFFTDQFRGAGLRPDNQLDRNIDGISGATLSVRAITRLSRLALYLDGHIEARP
jgi:hypothetical protein